MSRDPRDSEIAICTVSVGGRAVAAYTCRRDADAEAERVGGTIDICKLHGPDDIEHSADMEDEVDHHRASEWGAPLCVEGAAGVVVKHIINNFDTFRPSPDPEYSNYSRVLELPNDYEDLLHAVSDALVGESFDTHCKTLGVGGLWLEARRRKMTKSAARSR
jgi:hypothetical protein